ncbi:unnamed protein product [Blepharisma stoltei]|uniref:Major facilitator superfamily (MFS) profile domain-containing protein n=1 Tax=Blepharisma stoltei TaxID=1481888 RepID=A0AAU9K0Y4_9CILI|nr:unnamed protein product [Blepharisma stoltei]
MEKNLFAICRKEPIEDDSGEILSDKTALYSLCLENLVLTSVPATIFIIMAISRFCPLVAQFPTPKYSKLTKNSKFILTLCLFLSIYPIIQLAALITNKHAGGITVYYAITESLAWFLSGCVVFIEELKGLPRSWMLYSYWGISFISSLLKSLTRIYVLFKDEFICWSWFFHLIESLCSATIFSLALPETRNRTYTVGFTQNTQMIPFLPKLLIIWLMVNGQLLYGLAVLILPSYASELDASPTWIGLIFGAYAASILFSSPIFAKLSEIFGRVKIIVLGSFTLSFATLLFAFSDSIWMLIFSRILQGVAAAANFTPALALITDISPSHKLGEVLGEITGWSGLGMLIGPPLGGILYHLGGYSFPFIIGSAITFIQAVAVFVFLKDTEKKKENTSGKLSLFRGEFIEIIGVIIIGSGSLTMLEPMIPLILYSKFAINPLQMGLILALSVLSFGTISPLAGKISDRSGRRPIIIVGMLFLGVLLPLVCLPDSILLETFCMALIGAASSLVMVPVLPELADTVRKVESSNYEQIYATFNSSYAVGNIAGPVLGGLLISYLGFAYTLICFALLIIGYAIFLAIASQSNKALE